VGSIGPQSKHYTDQMRLFVDHQTKPVCFWRDEMLAKASDPAPVHLCLMLPPETRS